MASTSLDNLRDYRLLIFDADDTLRRCTVPGQPCPHHPNEWELLPNVARVLARFPWPETSFGIVSNQGGVALGYLSEHVAMALIYQLVHEIGKKIGWFPPTQAVRMCPHAPDAGCHCRKPSPYLVLDIARHFSPRYRLSDVLYVGDQMSDQEAAARAGVAFCWADDFFDRNRPMR